MNKQEAIEKIENAIPDFILNDFQRGEETGLSYALELVEELDEPEKPVVPQFVADWYENHKINLPYEIFNLCIDYASNGYEGDLYDWFKKNLNGAITILVNMHQLGYEVEKKKLYTVEIPNPHGLGHSILVKDMYGNIFITYIMNSDWRKSKVNQLTEAEIKKDFDWAWQFAKDVEE